MKRKLHLLLKFPEDGLETVVIQWEHALPTALIQLRSDPREPVQFPGERPEAPGHYGLPKDRPLAVDLPLRSFVDPTTGMPFSGPAYEANILISERAFELLRPEPDAVLPPEAMAECRTEALRALGIVDQAGAVGTSIDGK